MSSTLRFPYNHAVPNAGRKEASQIITLLEAADNLPEGGENAYVDVRAWHTAGDRNTEAPYTCVVLEFSASAATTIGDGSTQLIGLYGQIDLVENPRAANERKRTLLAILGINLGGTAPQIPIVQQGGGGDLVGFSQMVSNIAAYDRLSIGGVLGDVLTVEGVEVTVVARPLRRRDYLG